MNTERIIKLQNLLLEFEQLETHKSDLVNDETLPLPLKSILLKIQTEMNEANMKCAEILKEEILKEMK